MVSHIGTEADDLEAIGSRNRFWGISRIDTESGVVRHPLTGHYYVGTMPAPSCHEVAPIVTR